MIADTGQRVKEWQTIAERWCEITPLSGRELEIASQIHAQVTHRVRLRHCPCLTPEVRLLFGCRVLEIVSVLDVEERHVEQVCMAIERV